VGTLDQSRANNKQRKGKQRQMKARRLIYMIGLLLILFCVVACQDALPAENDTDQAQTTQIQPIGSSGLIHYEDAGELDRADRDALIGTLVLRDGCIRLDVSDLDDPSGAYTSYLTIWPPEFNMQFTGEEVLLLDERSQVVGQLADVFMVDGNPSHSLLPALESQRPAACPGPYLYINTISNLLYIPQ
jgi:hypothetical protein